MAPYFETLYRVLPNEETKLLRQRLLEPGQEVVLYQARSFPIVGSVVERIVVKIDSNDEARIRQERPQEPVVRMGGIQDTVGLAHSVQRFANVGFEPNLAVRVDDIPVRQEDVFIQDRNIRYGVQWKSKSQETPDKKTV